ncbi:related to TAD2-tRNA-specific adenosine deaminase 2 [Armillaria ostoyae]|uniref:Related to TAD2-tRNA-specific adenosine deaminase 2 n=1 Tax=Armillaria ostoyae TaxID=47428 RepID=A0A284RFX3_ARMOS|nr:related to TAD2-tRNA-specific adenosine deaminase 2 [Armillaria ostoyae]
MPSSNILNVHSQAANVQAIRQAIVDGLDRPTGQKQLPTLLLYDERGLRLYDDITTEVPEYYLFGAEEEILKTKADEIVRIMHGGGGGVQPDEVILELGSGSLRKTSHILRGLAELVKGGSSRPPITYYALDLEERELERTLGDIAESDVGKLLQGKVKTKGMWGTYDDGLKFVEAGGLRSIPSQASIMESRFSRGLKLDARDVSPNSAISSDSSATESMNSESPPSTPGDTQPPLHLLFLGSSLGNFSRHAGADFLRSLPLRPGSGDTLLLGMDHDNAKEVIEEAYNDRMGYTKKFIMNGLRGAGKVLRNEDLFDPEKWSYVNNYDESERRHEAFFKCRAEHTVCDPATAAEFHFLEDELVKIEESFKFSDRDAYILFTESNLRPIQRWSDSSSRYSLWLLERPPFIFPLLSSPSDSEENAVGRKLFSTSPFGVPSLQDWRCLWLSWDVITRKMMPPSMLYQKPIDLRHICLFYLGHIPTFLDIHLSRLLEEPHTEPEGFKYIFERGIDPIVDDPSVCHPHSEVPTEDKDWPSLNSILLFQNRVRERLLSLYRDMETGKKPLTRKMGRVLFMTYEHEALHAETLLYMLLQRAGTGTLSPPGFAIPDWESLSGKWAAEPKPFSPTVTLGSATVTLGHDDVEAEDGQASDVSTHEYGWDNEHPTRQVHVNEFRIEWRPVTNGEFYEFYKSGDGKDIQVPTSWVQVAGAMQVRTLYGPVSMDVAYNWPVIASYNDLSRYALVKGGRLPTEPELRLFYDKFEAGYEGGANVGFRNWHPIPATTGGERDGGRGSNGGVWEWTSTLFDKYDGFAPSALYPGYSMDFFDGAHQVVMGGSYATIPRIAERRSVRNWYQRNYPYPWVGGRVVYDM